MQVLSCTIGNMASGATYTVHVTSPTTTAGSLPNTAVASSTNGPNVEGTASIVVNPPAVLPVVLGETTPAPAPVPAPAPAPAAIPAAAKPAPLAFTGENVGRLVVSGLLLMLLGGVLTGAGRRRLALR